MKMIWNDRYDIVGNEYVIDILLISKTVYSSRWKNISITIEIHNNNIIKNDKLTKP